MPTVRLRVSTRRGERQHKSERKAHHEYTDRSRALFRRKEITYHRVGRRSATGLIKYRLFSWFELSRSALATGWVWIMKELSGRTAVITGGGSGFGRELAILCAKEGMRVVLADVDVAGMKGTEVLLPAESSEPLYSLRCLGRSSRGKIGRGGL